MQNPYIFIDADGTQSSWLYLIVEKSTQVFYASQCAGLENQIRSTEGYLIPLIGLTFDTDVLLDEYSHQLRQIFHQGQSCRSATKLNTQQLLQLQSCIENITIWFTNNEPEDDQRQHLCLDMSRQEEITEAWVPVISPYGKAILIWKNCD
ncbi:MULTISPECIES: DUF6210 family protein [unclassified Acinetobacter]|uniref:DUF6210 family protein n=1 Tax=unclassified Acinetobacter TaxID=196816 RepID=UPI0025786479|nr:MULTISPECIES: DUF6210 family protein [unclassified Acinetobacter]MDM1763534.1 hypothetical protein [Acinetobacter sp. 226-1]MDM1767013.1 hypothetical protein [Acinetobacter sp. 226-4]